MVDPTPEFQILRPSNHDWISVLLVHFQGWRVLVFPHLFAEVRSQSRPAVRGRDLLLSSAVRTAAQCWGAPESRSQRLGLELPPALRAEWAFLAFRGRFGDAGH